VALGLFQVAANTVSGVITYIVQLILVILGSIYMTTMVLPLLFVIYFIQSFYLRISRKMRSLELEAESPLYQQFTETAEGIATIRAFGSQEWFRREFLLRLDQSQRPFYLLLCMEQWLSLVLNIVVGVTAVILIALACTTPTSSSGNLGIALTTILTMNTNTQLQHLLSAWIRTESSLGTVARTKEYEESTPNENAWRMQHPENLDESWPRGAIDIQSVTVEYQKQDDRHMALDNVSFVVEAGQKLGICGRTGRYVARCTLHVAQTKSP
jgi:ATP-binding cassette, subfamily C (CFTR/MRP), member 1